MLWTRRTTLREDAPDCTDTATYTERNMAFCATGWRLRKAMNVAHSSTRRHKAICAPSHMRSQFYCGWTIACYHLRPPYRGQRWNRRLTAETRAGNREKPPKSVGQTRCHFIRPQCSLTYANLEVVNWADPVGTPIALAARTCSASYKEMSRREERIALVQTITRHVTPTPTDLLEATLRHGVQSSGGRNG